MPNNCKSVLIDDVIEFFEKEIDGTGKNDGYPRNDGVPNSLRQSKSWELCELTEEEFRRLEIPDGSHTLIKDKDNTTIRDFVKTNIEDRVERLKKGEELTPLIIREPLSGDNKEASFFIEDGAKRAIAYKFYFESNPFKPVRAYIGRGRV